MLVLSRKTNEKIVIGGDITITVVKIKGHVVRIGIEAPDDISIVRDDIQSGPDDEEGGES